MLANANWFGDTFGESIGDTICAAATDGEWHRGSVGDVVAIMDLRWPRVEGRREDRLSSFCEAKQIREGVREEGTYVLQEGKEVITRIQKSASNMFPTNQHGAANEQLDARSRWH